MSDFRQPLTVSDIERLAKAGVTIKFEDIATQVQQDYTPAPEYQCPETLDDSFWQRWNRANPMQFGQGQMRTFTIHASEYDGTVYVFVQPHNAPPFIIEDQAPLYPSDALMAKLHLWEKSKP